MWFFIGLVMIVVGIGLLVLLFKVREDADDSFMALCIPLIGLIIVVGGMLIQANVPPIL